MRVELTEAAVEAERRIVTTCCDKPKAIEQVECSPSDFGHPKWKACMSVLVELYSRDRAISDLTLMDEVTKRFPGVVGFDDLVNLDGLPSMVGEYSRIVRTEAARRRLQLGLGELQGQTKELPPEAILERLSEVARDAAVEPSVGTMTISELAKERFAQYAEIADAQRQGKDGRTGFSTGIEKLDEILGGLQPGIVTLLAARPGMGKSTLALNLTANISREGVGVHVFSLEEPRHHYMDRVFSLATRVSSDRLRAMSLSEGEFQQFTSRCERVHKRQHWVVNDGAARAEEIVRIVRLRAAANETRVVVIDYINILKRLPGEGKREMMDQAINVFADAAKRDGMAYLVLAQLNRGVEGRDDPEPRLSDIKECGTLEERAKAVLMLHHPHEHDGSQPADVVQILIRKNSQGRRGFVSCSWQPERMYVGDRRSA